MNFEEYTLHCKLDELLKQRGVSILKLSQDIGHRRTTIMELAHNSEMKKKKISAALIMKLCLYFNVTPNDLFEIRHKE